MGEKLETSGVVKLKNWIPIDLIRKLRDEFHIKPLKKDAYTKMREMWKAEVL